MGVLIWRRRETSRWSHPKPRRSVSVHENVMFPPDDVRPSERLNAGPRMGQTVDRSQRIRLGKA
jgi:hypothetical protein